MALWLHPQEKSDQNRLPPLQQKSRIPVRVPQLSSDTDRGSSSVDDADKKVHLQKDSGSKVQNRRSSRIPITTDERRSKVHTKVNLPKTVKTACKGKPTGGVSGMFFSSQPHFFSSKYYSKIEKILKNSYK